MKVRLSLIIIISLLVTCIFNLGSSALSAQDREIIIVGEDNQIFDVKASGWEIPLTVLAYGKGAKIGEIVTFSIDGKNVFETIESRGAIPVHQLENYSHWSDLKAWTKLKTQSTSFASLNISPNEASMFETLTAKVRDIQRSRADIRPTYLTVRMDSLPFNPKAETSYSIKLGVQVGGSVVTWEGTVLVLDIPIIQTNPVWVPAQLHIHSNFSDGTKSPKELAELMFNKGYVVGYITDETDGGNDTEPAIPATTYSGATWNVYQQGVRDYTANIAMFPGSEIAGSTVNKGFGNHKGHALAYGIGSFTGSNSFETTGLRYRWFLPQDLLNNINSNKSGAHSTIAHPTNIFYPWSEWALSVRYHGMELMSGLQTSFAPQSSPVVRWRSELTRHLPGVFNGLAFPSARTGSDYSGVIGSPGINYYTFIGLDSAPPWSNLRSLSQTVVDTALRKGRTIASRLGGVAAFTIKDSSGTDRQIGDYYSQTANTQLSSHIIVQPTISGTYRIRVVENDFSRTVYDQIHFLSGGVASQFDFNFSFDPTTTRGNFYYHLIVEDLSVSGGDYIYTSPIFIKSI
ncbi:MAG: PHP domain-containing protein [Bacillota bacterium]|nr:MAG: PHP domain-containing protein [Bacillota bacterium]